MAIKASTVAQLRKEGITADSEDMVIKAAIKKATGAPVSASMLAEAREALSAAPAAEAPAKAEAKPKAEKPKAAAKEAKPKAEKVEKPKAEPETPESMLKRMKKENPERYDRVLAIIGTTKDGRKPSRVRVRSAKPGSKLEFEIKVQDLFQVRYHPDEKAEMRKVNRAANRPAKAEKPATEAKPKAAKKAVAEA